MLPSTARRAAPLTAVETCTCAHPSSGARAASCARCARFPQPHEPRTQMGDPRKEAGKARLARAGACGGTTGSGTERWRSDCRSACGVVSHTAWYPIRRGIPFIWRGIPYGMVSHSFGAVSLTRRFNYPTASFPPASSQRRSVGSKAPSALALPSSLLVSALRKSSRTSRTPPSRPWPDTTSPARYLDVCMHVCPYVCMFIYV
jgi:hypothetical protein